MDPSKREGDVNARALARKEDDTPEDAAHEERDSPLEAHLMGMARALARKEDDTPEDAAHEERDSPLEAHLMGRALAHKENDKPDDVAHEVMQVMQLIQMVKAQARARKEDDDQGDATVMKVMQVIQLAAHKENIRRLHAAHDEYCTRLQADGYTDQTRSSPMVQQQATGSGSVVLSGATAIDAIEKALQSDANAE